MKRGGSVIGLLAAAALAGGCGQKGPLYLPDSSGSVVTRPTQTAPPANNPAGQPAGQPAAKPADKADDAPAKPATPKATGR